MVSTDERRQIDFPGKDRGEEFQFYFRQHWIRLWWPFRRLVVWTLLIGIGLILTNTTFSSPDDGNMRHVALIILCIAFLYTQLSFLSSFYKYFLYVIIVTDKKVHRIKKTLMTVDDHQSIDLWTLEDITKNQHGIVQNMLGFGTLVLVMQTQDALRIHFTPFISTKHEMVMRLRENARTQLAPAVVVPQPPPPTAEEQKDKTQEANNE